MSFRTKGESCMYQHGTEIHQNHGYLSIDFHFLWLSTVNFSHRNTHLS